jgi:hypothetical protein
MGKLACIFYSKRALGREKRMKKRILFTCCIFFLLKMPAQVISPEIKADTVEQGYIPPDSDVLFPDTDFSSYMVIIFLPKSKIWVDQMVCGPELPNNLRILFTSQGKGTIVIYSRILVESGGKLQHGAPRKFVLEENGQFAQKPPGFQWSLY